MLTMMFLVQGYLRDLGQQVSQVQRSVNEMEELVAIFRRDPAIQDAPDAQRARFTKGPSGSSMWTSSIPDRPSRFIMT